MEGGVFWPYFDPEYENLSHRINPPRVSIDNTIDSDCTLIKVDSVNKPGTLLEVVQVLSDLDLIITKAYISSDGGWFMDVFHVTDQHGNKLSDKKAIEYIETALGPKSKVRGTNASWSGKTIGLHSIGDHIAIELIGTDRPGLISEIFAVLSSLHCNVLGAEVWTHKMRVACILYVNDGNTTCAVDDPARLAVMEEQLRNVLRGCGNDTKGAHTTFSVGSTHVDRRLHQLMFADKDYENNVEETEGKDVDLFKPVVTIDYCQDKGYSVVIVRCKDRSKLLFDIVCTLTDMQYSVFHASISSEGPYAMQEFYVRHKDGSMLNSQADKKKVIMCLEAAILRRVSEGLRLEVCARDRVGLLSDVTRVLREHGLSVARAGASTVGGQAMNVFYIKDSSGSPVDVNTIEALRREIGQTVRLNVRKVPNNSKMTPESNGWAKTCFSFGSLLERFLA